MIELNLVVSAGTYLLAIGIVVFLIMLATNWTVLMLAGQDGGGPGNHLFYLVLKEDGKFFKLIARGFLSAALLIVAGVLVFGIGVLIALYL